MTSYIQNPLDLIFSATSHITILRALLYHRQGMSGRAVAKTSGINHQTCAIGLKKLERLGAIEKQGSGKVQLFRLNFNNYLIKNCIIPFFKKEKELSRTVQSEIFQAFENEAVCATIFGSTARSQDKPGSDIDLLLVVEENKKNKVMKHALSFSSDFYQRYSIRLSPIVFTISEVRGKIKNKAPLFMNILREGIELLPIKLSGIIQNESKIR